jgi:hypothetical protein
MIELSRHMCALSIQENEEHKNMKEVQLIWILDITFKKFEMNENMILNTLQIHNLV